MKSPFPQLPINRCHFEKAATQEITQAGNISSILVTNINVLVVIKTNNIKKKKTKAEQLQYLY